MPRIAFILKSFYEDQIGGAERQVQLLAQALRDNNWETSYICERREDKPTRENCSGMEVLTLPIRKKRTTWLNYSLLQKAMQECQADLFYQRVRHPYTGLAAKLAAKLKKPFIFAAASQADVIRDRDIRRANNKAPILDYWLRPLNRYLEDWGILNANEIILQTNEQLQSLKKYYQCSGTVIPNHVVIRDIHSVKKSPPEVIWISNIKPFKRPKIFIDLAEHCQDLKAVFIMIGSCVDAKLRNLLEDNQRKLSNFIYLGPLDPIKAEERIATSSVLVNTSEFEGFPNAFQQAWIYGVPTLSLGVDPDGVLNLKGFGACTKSPEDLEFHLRKLLQDEVMRTHMGRKAQQFSKENYDLKKLLPEYLSLFEKVINA